MTDQQIMAIAHDDLVRLFMLRRDDLKAASKEATRIAMNERRRNSPEYRAYHAEYDRNWRKANEEIRKAYMKQWRERRRKKALGKQPAVTAASAVTVGPPAIIPEASETPEIVIPRVKVVVPKMPEPDEPRLRSDRETATYWRQVIDDLEYRFFDKQIDVETYFGGRNAAMSHLLAAEQRMRTKRKITN